MIKKCVWILSLLVFSVMLVLAVNPPSLTNFMQLHGKVSNYFGIDEELTVQVGEDEDNVFHVGLNSDGTYGKNYAWKVYNGKPGDKLYFYIETQAMPAAETYQPQTVKEINLVLPPDCNNQKTWNWSWSKCTNKSKTGTFTCEGENKTTTETCCEPEWGNYTDWSECKNKEKSRIEFDVNQCDPEVQVVVLVVVVDRFGAVKIGAPAIPC
ncbi:hypothetical protein HZC30_01350 [Candidatus Woesearchaeota archaeon]|nr:hypothetical protein [Candidatus Woesearchaeota archaeon]